MNSGLAGKGATDSEAGGNNGPGQMPYRGSARCIPLNRIAKPRPGRKTLEEAMGLLATSQPASSDAEITQWLDERRVEKYG